MLILLGLQESLRLLGGAERFLGFLFVVEIFYEIASSQFFMSIDRISIYCCEFLNYFISRVVQSCDEFNYI